jgi:hypothetical protein
MRIATTLAAASVVALTSAASFAGDAKPLFVYVSPNPIGVNDFLKLGKVGTERVAKALGAEAKTYESSDPTTQRQTSRQPRKRARRSSSRSASNSTTCFPRSRSPIRT